VTKSRTQLVGQVGQDCDSSSRRLRLVEFSTVPKRLLELAERAVDIIPGLDEFTGDGVTPDVFLGAVPVACHRSV